MPLKHTVEQREYDNGTKALLIDVPGLPVTSYGIHFRSYEDTVPAPQQTRHLLEHVVAAYTTNPEYSDKVALRKLMERNGAYLNATTSVSGLTYVGDSISDEWSRLIGLRQVLIESPAITDDSVRIEKGNVLQELKRNIGNQPRLAYQLARRAIGEMFYTDTEAIETVSNITTDHVRAIYDKTHVSKNMRIIITGDLHASTDNIDSVLGEWNLPTGEAIARQLAARSKGGCEYVQNKESKSIYTNIIFSTPETLDVREREIMKIINYMLFNSQASKAFGEARSRGLCYQMWGYIDDNAPNPYTWITEFPVSPENLEPVVEIIVKNLHGLMSGELDDEDILSAAAFAKGRFIKSGQTSEELYGMYSADFFSRDVVYDVSERESVYDTVRKEEIMGVAHKFLTSGQWAYAGAGTIDKEEFTSRFDSLRTFMKGI